jgi:hypothetical protein
VKHSGRGRKTATTERKSAQRRGAEKGTEGAEENGIDQRSQRAKSRHRQQQERVKPQMMQKKQEEERETTKRAARESHESARIRQNNHH